ncbi:RNA methyltransferase [Desulfospira joergensenii]|uniref:RNA methyltransferase n=1 Tax=Desulfospira joergensenii TaxID=53329 RepID=UPI0003B3BC62|nr:RNA methyltransferase [Desulfospira joergensenii]
MAAPADNLYLALVHYPVMNRKNMEIGSALTNMDLHDIARACRTFGVRGYYVVTPFEDQVELADQIIRHWTHGKGGELNPSRKEALEMIRVTRTFEQALEEIEKKDNREVVTIATSARDSGDCITPRELKTRLKNNASHVLAFGTAWGLTEGFIDSCNLRLAPINGPGAYNHLSVRSAASIYLDRITND